MGGNQYNPIRPEPLQERHTYRVTFRRGEAAGEVEKLALEPLFTTAEGLEAGEEPEEDENGEPSDSIE